MGKNRPRRVVVEPAAPEDPAARLEVLEALLAGVNLPFGRRGEWASGERAKSQPAEGQSQYLPVPPAPLDQDPAQGPLFRPVQRRPRQGRVFPGEVLQYL